MSNWFDFVILIFATFRLTRLIVYDKITEFLRRPFHQTQEETLPDGTIEEYIIIKGTGLRHWIGELLNCHWCTGIWSAIIIYLCYFFWPSISQPFISILAMAGCASIVQTLLERE
ncbi:DUF1360 domain-containing protein [Bacillus sp. CGMCC 1.16607]|uniref:DUF1360 domain-containing protein n=1 Tax=Bacillus sp. CGMCC 1.16607 TaxID=3351842 RepID=UPI00363CF1D0